MINKSSFKLSIIIPCYNEKNTIQKIINKVVDSLNFHNFKNMMDDYASKSEDHALHAQKIHNAVHLLNFGWRDNMIE